MGIAVESFPIIFLFVILGISACIDYRIQKIPNLVTFPAMIISIVYHFLLAGFDGMLFSITGLATGIGIFILPYIMGGMGAGDAKLMGAVGAMLGAKGVFIAFLYVALIGGIYAAVLVLLNLNYFKSVISEYMETAKTFVLTKKLILEPVRSSYKKPRLCYGVAIAIGTYIYMGLNAEGFKLIV